MACGRAVFVAQAHCCAAMGRQVACNGACCRTLGRCTAAAMLPPLPATANGDGGGAAVRGRAQAAAAPLLAAVGRGLWGA